MRGAPGQEQQAAAVLGGAQVARGMWASGSNKRSHASHSVRYLELRGSCQGGRSRRAKIGGLGGKWCWMVRDRIGWSSVKLRDAKLKLPRSTVGHRTNECWRKCGERDGRRAGAIMFRFLHV